ncbi:MAG: P-loop NTPase [Candidatus Caldatribacteriaceae bacterium]
MKIAVASGKGGTGKTLIATSLALALSLQKSVVFVDADVEAPNAHLFLRPDFTEEIPVLAFVPEIQEGLCDGCGECVNFCAFSALALVERKVLFFPELCHSCEGCRIVCPKAAIQKSQIPRGFVRRGKARNTIDFRQGVLVVGEPRASMVIHALKRNLPQDPETVVIIDCPPGTGCSLVAAVEDVDYGILVTEPTPFGFSDLKMAVAVMEELRISFGVVINKQGLDHGKLETYCRDKNIDIVGRIPFQKSIGQGYAQGLTLYDQGPAFHQELLQIFENIRLKGPKP